MSDSSNTIQLVREDGPVRVAPLARAVGVLQQLSRLDGRDESAYERELVCYRLSAQQMRDAVGADLAGEFDSLFGDPASVNPLSLRASETALASWGMSVMSQSSPGFASMAALIKDGVQLGPMVLGLSDDD